MSKRRSQAKHRVEGISVFVRVRAGGAQDEGGDSSQVVKVNERTASICMRDARRPNSSIECSFDRIFGPDAVQEDVFLGIVPTLDTVIKGYNACVLAYGQTGSGKTHTLIGPGGGTRLPDNQAEWGVIPRAVQFLFDRLALASEEDETLSYSVTCSFLQIYNENLVDLLLQDGRVGGEAAGSPSLQIREETGGGGGRGCAHGVAWNRQKYDGHDGGEDATAAENEKRDILGAGGHHQNRASSRQNGAKANENRRVFVNGLSSFRVGGAHDVLRYVNLGAANRRVRATQHNEASSRSHAVMQLMVEVKSGGGGVDGGGGDNDSVGNNGHVTYRQAKLSLVDLAGSEKMDSGQKISKGHFKELRSINQSLSALGNVVSALTEKGRTHVPYRDSKLTRLLQDSLGGNTRTTIIACVNPVAGQTHETINTLQFADRAKKVMVRLRANEVVDDRVLLAQAQAEIKRLKRRLREALDGTLLGAAAEDIADVDFDNANGGSRGNQQEEGDETRILSKKIKVGSPRSCVVGSGDSLPRPAEEVDHPEKAAGETNCDEAHRIVLAKRSNEGIGRVTAAAESVAVPAVNAAQRRQIAKLIAENESLRESNDRLRADVQRLLGQRNKQQSKRQRRQQQQQQQRSGGQSGNIPPGLPPAPIDWSARYADAAADARRRRPMSSHMSSPNSSLNRSTSSSSSSRLLTTGRKGNSSPSPAASTVPGGRVSNLPKFFRRHFGEEGAGEECTDDEGEPVENGLSTEEVRAFLGQNTEGPPTAMVVAMPRSTEEEEAEAQLDMFRREIQGGVVSESLAKRQGASSEGGEGKRAGVASADGEITPGNQIVAGSGDPDEQTDIEVFLDRSQRLEDLMFEAQGRERRRLREERGRLASARRQRLELEAQLAELTSGGGGFIATKRDTDMHTKTKEGRQQQLHEAPPSFDGAIPVPNARNIASPDSGEAGRNDLSGSNESSTNRNQDYSSGPAEKRIGWAERPSSSSSSAAKGATTPDVPATAATAPAIPATTAATTAMMMTVLAPHVEKDRCRNDVHFANTRERNASNNPAFGVRRTVTPTKHTPERRRQHSGCSPSISPSRGTRQRRPATRTGGPPTGSSRARPRSRRTQPRAGGGSGSPTQGQRFAFVEPASPQHDHAILGIGSSLPHRRRQQQTRGGYDSSGGGISSMMTDLTTTSALKTRQASARSLLTSPQSSLGLRQRAGRSGSKGVDLYEQGGEMTRGLAYGVADLGLRLKVYSFRYDCYYECQVVGYDSRRRMHRCAYDATGEKQWHDLAKKRFEVVGHNGVILRSTESAPPALAPSPAPECPGSRSSTPPLLLVPTSPGYP